MTARSQWRSWLVLGRVSNLPTIWSNCLAAWLLGDAAMVWSRFGLLCLGATLLYVSGMFLNDAFDEEFDRQHRRERPIPSGVLPVRTVWQAGFGLMLAGLLVISLLGRFSALNALLLAGCILVYNAVHKVVTFSPLFMALCRFFLYTTAVSAATGGITGHAAWAGLALAAYITGLSYLARRESTRGAVQNWPVLLLLAPVALALLVNDGSYRQPALLVGAVFGLWLFRSLRWAYFSPVNVGRSVAGLLAGIVWVDLLAVANQPPTVGAVFLGFFLLALLFQRVIPAT